MTCPQVYLGGRHEMAAREGDAVVVDNMAANIADLQKRAEAAGDDSGASMSTGEKKLLLRHRDSFMVTKSHHHVPELGGGGGGGGSGRATVAGLYTASGLAEAVRQGSAAAGAAGGAGGEEGGEAHTAYVLDGLEEMGGRGSVAEGAGGGGGGEGGGGFASPSAQGRDGGGGGALSPSSAGSVDESPRRKNRLFSFVKGVASALGLRASKKGKKGGGASPEAPGSASAQSPRGGSFAPGGGGSEGAGDDPFGAGYEPAQDETGYIPSHRTLPTPRSILKTGPDGSPRAAPGRRDSSDPSSPRGASASSQAEALGDAYGEEGGGASALGSGRRGLSFADQHGHDLELVKYSERLHYSVASEHVQGEESSRSCSVM